MHKCFIGPEIYEVPDGSILGDVLIAWGISHSHPCMGMGRCKKCTVTVNGREVLSCQYRIYEDVTVELPDVSKISSETGISAVSHEKVCTFILDIGTTTLALVGTDSEGDIVKTVTEDNPQKTAGADVMSRIAYCTANGTKKMQRLLIGKVNEMLSEFSFTQADKLIVAGNTTMLHIFFGEDCSSLGKYPYTPVFLEGRSLPGALLGLDRIEKVESLPCISSFVGADIVAGINSIPLPITEKYSILLDLGTNAEIALINENEILCTAAAAGPCFEGANISCGMSARDGAVTEFRSATSYKTVNSAPAVGICGTGLIDVISVLLENEIIDETGYMESERFRIVDNVCLIPSDVREYQLAKSAVYSGILTLMKKADVSFSDIEAVYISGGFSAKINIGNAVKTGLLPCEFKEKCVSVNNSCVAGVLKYLRDKDDISAIAEKSRYIDLSGDKVFSELFTKNIQFC